MTEMRPLLVGRPGRGGMVQHHGEQGRRRMRRVAGRHPWLDRTVAELGVPLPRSALVLEGGQRRPLLKATSENCALG